MMMMNRCVWCARRDDTVREVSVSVIDRWGKDPAEQRVWLHGEHEDAFRAFAGLANRRARTVVLALAGIALALLGLVTAAAAFRFDSRFVALAVGAGVALIGVLFIRWPFATPETVSGIGVDLSIKLVRVYGSLLVAGGLAMMVFLP